MLEIIGIHIYIYTYLIHIIATIPYYTYNSGALLLALLHVMTTTTTKPETSRATTPGTEGSLALKILRRSRAESLPLGNLWGPSTVTLSALSGPWLAGKPPASLRAGMGAASGAIVLKSLCSKSLASNPSL